MPAAAREVPMKYLANPVIFSVSYVLLMLTTYYWPLLGSNTYITRSIEASSGATTYLFATWIHLAVLLALVVITWFRGTFINRKWLIVFPILALIFDMGPVINNIPLIPTIMHLLAIILGVALKSEATLVPQSSSGAAETKSGDNSV
jgi:O-antigen ligase